jgi:hypothetical protein
MLIASFPAIGYALSAGLDPSWDYSLNFLAGSEYVFGRDVGFTYGPLGFLAYPMDLGNNLFFSILLRLFLQAMLGVALVGALRRTRSAAALLLVAVAFACTLGTGVDFETRALLTIAALSFYALDDRRPWALGVAAALCALCLFIKLNVGLTTLATCGAVALVWVVRERWKAWPALAAAAGAYVACVVAAIAVLFHSVGNFTAWLRVSSQFADGYSVAMSMVGRDAQVVLGLGCALLCAIWVAVLRRSDKHTTLMAAALVPALFLAFKRGFVRQDGHMFTFFTFLALAMALLLLHLRATRERLIGAAVVILLVGIGISVQQHNGEWNADVSIGELSGAHGFSNVVDVVQYGKTRERLKHQSNQNLSVTKLPEEWVRAIKDEGRRVGRASVGDQLLRGQPARVQADAGASGLRGLYPLSRPMECRPFRLRQGATLRARRVPGDRLPEPGARHARDVAIDHRQLRAVSGGGRLTGAATPQGDAGGGSRRGVGDYPRARRGMGRLARVAGVAGGPAAADSQRAGDDEQDVLPRASIEPRVGVRERSDHGLQDHAGNDRQRPVDQRRAAKPRRAEEPDRRNAQRAGGEVQDHRKRRPLLRAGLRDRLAGGLDSGRGHRRLTL